MGSKLMVAGFITDPREFLELGEKARARGFKKLDCIMPYPVHGFEEAYGIGWSWIGLAAFIALLTGWGLGFLMQYWMHQVDYPINFGGRPHLNAPAFIPVTFECGILLSALTTLGSLIFAGKLFPHPCLKVVRARCSDDLFAILIPANDGEERARAEAFLRETGVKDVESFDAAYMDRTQCGLAKGKSA